MALKLNMVLLKDLHSTLKQNIWGVAKNIADFKRTDGKKGHTDKGRTTGHLTPAILNH